MPTPIALKTRIYSSLREFVLSRRSLAAFAIFALISGAMTFGLYQNNRNLNLQRMKDRVMAIAATGALQFKETDINAVRDPDDISKPEYATLIATLNLVRRSNPGIQFTYIFRKTANPSKLAFVADADSLNPLEKKDLNHDGIIDERDTLQWPGTLYDAFASPNLLEGFSHTSADEGQDQWGSYISGYAPIIGSSGEAIALLGIDVFASELDKISAESFAPLYFFIGFFLLFLAIRFSALNRSLLAECAGTMNANRRKVGICFLFALLLGLGVYVSIQQYAYRQFIDETGKRLTAIAVTAVNDFNPQDLEGLRFARDMKTDTYQRVFHQLNEIRRKNPEISVAYIVRPTKDPMQFEFVANSDANYNLPQYFNVTIDDDEFNQSSDESPWPGYIYEDFFPVFRLALKRPAYGYAPVDKWGSTITGMAPIFDNNGKLAGILSLDFILDNNDNYNVLN